MENNDVLGNTLITAIKDLVKDTADPGNWAGSIIYMLEALDDEANHSHKKNDFEMTLACLQDTIKTRLEKGKW